MRAGRERTNIEEQLSLFRSPLARLFALAEGVAVNEAVGGRLFDDFARTSGVGGVLQRN
jgi:hypothetical protein